MNIISCLKIALISASIFLIIELLMSCLLEQSSIIENVFKKIISLITNIIKRKKTNKEVSLNLLPELDIIRIINTGETEQQYIDRMKKEIRRLLQKSLYSGYSIKNMEENGVVRKKDDGIYVYYTIISSYDKKILAFYLTEDSQEVEEFFKSHSKIIGFENGMKFTKFFEIFDV